MCGRYTIRRIDLLHGGFDARLLPSFEEFTEHPRFNIAPSQMVPVVRVDAKGERVIDAVRWGLIPSWTKGKPKQQPINARGETVATSGMFRQAFERRRCLVPADGFYEWRKIDPKTKQPMYVRRKDRDLFAFAGLWERWKPDGEAEPIDTCTIITTTPNELMAPIHDRMPVVLDRADYDRWLDRETPGADVVGLLKPYPAESMEAIPVSTHVNSPRNDDQACIAPLAGVAAAEENAID
jgi:putative SOS response-associated peptidase YedK